MLDGLSDRQREVMVLRVIDDLSIDQVAYVMSISPGAVKTHQRRAERHLAKHLDRSPAAAAKAAA